MAAHLGHSPGAIACQQMKKKGAICDFREQRDNDLFRAYRRQLQQTGYVHLPQLLDLVIRTRAERFYVSEERAAIVINELLRGKSIDHMQTQKRRMYEEIYRRFLRLTQRRPYLSYNEAITIVVNQPAPEFYLTVGSAIVILHKIRKRRREEARRR